MQLSENARRVLQARYLRRDAQEQVNETPEQLFARVARAVAHAELLIRLSIPYRSERAVTFARQLMRFMTQEALCTSVALANELTPFSWSLQWLELRRTKNVFTSRKVIRFYYIIKSYYVKYTRKYANSSSFHTGAD